ncbi:MAG: hypothetical protein IJ011_09410 [Clostridia bacterium]|nr:hypothetical protein [Clostridia bacterium]
MKKTKILASILAFVLIFGSMSALSLTATATDTNSDSKVDFYQALDVNANKTISYVSPSEGIDADGINTYEEFAYALQNYGTDKFPAQVIELTGDLDMGGLTMESTIFGNLVDGMVIDGNGYAIKNLDINYWQNRGLFEVATNAHFVIKNLDFGTAEAPITGILGGGQWVNHGLILGRSSYGGDEAYSFDIDNVDMYVSLNRSNQGYKGGLGAMFGKAPLSADSSIKNSNVYGALTHNAKTGNCYTAAFVGNITLPEGGNATLTIENCANYATLTGGNCTAAFVGSQEGGVDVVLNNCINYGTIVSEGDSVSGIIAATKAGNATIDNCVNLGTVTGASNVAGILGLGNADGTINITNSINAANITAGADKAVSHYANTVTSVTNSSALATATLTGTETAFEGNGTLADLTAVAAKMRELKMGYYVVDGDKVVVDSKVPQIVGAQTTAVADGKFDVRFISVLKNDDLSQYSKVGFTVAATASNGQTLNESKDSTIVFTSLNASVDGAMKTYKNYELGGDYITAIAWTGVPASDGETNHTVSFTVTPYAVSLDGATTYSGISYTFTYVNGVYTVAD